MKPLQYVDVEAAKRLIYAIVEAAYADVKKYHHAVTTGRNRISGYRNYHSSIDYFTKPYHKGKNEHYPSYFKYQMILVGNEGDGLVKRILTNVLKMEKEIVQLGIN